MPSKEDIRGWVRGPYKDVTGFVIGRKIYEIQIGTEPSGRGVSYVEIGYVSRGKAFREHPPEFRSMPPEELGIVVPL